MKTGTRHAGMDSLCEVNIAERERGGGSTRCDVSMFRCFDVSRKRFHAISVFSFEQYFVKKKKA